MCLLSSWVRTSKVKWPAIPNSTLTMSTSSKREQSIVSVRESVEVLAASQPCCCREGTSIAIRSSVGRQCRVRCGAVASRVVLLCGCRVPVIDRSACRGAYKPSRTSSTRQANNLLPRRSEAHQPQRTPATPILPNNPSHVAAPTNTQAHHHRITQERKQRTPP